MTILDKDISSDLLFDASRIIRERLEKVDVTKIKLGGHSKPNKNYQRMFNGIMQ